MDWLEAPTPEPVGALLAGGLPTLTAGVLARRGIESAEAARRFLSPSRDQLLDPLTLSGMQAAVTRLAQAIREGQRVVIVGDYDADGISSAALLSAVFRACGLDVETLLPHRERDGYGLGRRQIEQAHQLGGGLVVAVDCGTNDRRAAEYCLELGIDLIVVDHHLPDDELPPEVVLINPLKAGCDYPFKRLAAAGLSLKLCLALGGHVGRDLPVDGLLRIASLGTIADMVPLIGENRVIASLGLAALGSVRSPGLIALMDAANVKRPVTADDVAFRIAPRINAAGRIDEPSLALATLLSRDPAESRQLARRLDELNSRRRELEAQVVETARQRFLELGTLPPILVEWDADWSRGVVGIAAGRLAREFCRPTVLLAVAGELAVGSGRSIDGIHLHDFLSRWSPRLRGFGGHSQAIGLSAEVDRLAELRDEWIAGAAAWSPELFERRREYEYWIHDPAELPAIVEELEALEPFGSGHPRPLFRLGPLDPCGSLRDFGDDHLEVRATAGGGAEVRLVAWRWADRRRIFMNTFEALGAVEFDDYLRQPIVRVVDARTWDE